MADAHGTGSNEPDWLKVLDKGFVRLVDFMASDLHVVRFARASYDAAWRTGEDEGSDTKLIRYLMRHRHTSPFESCEFIFEVKAPIVVMRQWSRHRTWDQFSINELSGRYKELSAEFYVPDAAVIGVQSANNKQARDLIPFDDATKTKREGEIFGYVARCDAAFREYEWLLSQGWPRELARIVLPLSTYTHLFAKVDLHNLFHFLDLRTHGTAQLEIREYAEAILKLITPIVPVSVQAWKDFQEPWG